jgi:hypothetical protein
MHKYVFATIIGLSLVGTGLRFCTTPAVAAEGQESASVLQADGTATIPAGFRSWVFLGAPLTPEGLNNGKFNCDQPGGCTKSNFPEFHHVYVEKKNVDAYLKTGDFPEGTVIVKELTRVLDPMFPDGSRVEPSGRGYFNGALNGIDMMVKDKTRFADSNGWGFFTFGHHPMPYEKTSQVRPVAECAGCHIANVSKTDMTWVQFYPLLRDKPGY